MLEVRGEVYMPVAAFAVPGPLDVVDSQLRVHGLEGLRVVDASIMPAVISANTMLTTIMAGEKIADTIKSGH